MLGQVLKPLQLFRSPSRTTGTSCDVVLPRNIYRLKGHILRVDDFESVVIVQIVQRAAVRHRALYVALRQELLFVNSFQVLDGDSLVSVSGRDCELVVVVETHHCRRVYSSHWGNVGYQAVAHLPDKLL